MTHLKVVELDTGDLSGPNHHAADELLDDAQVKAALRFAWAGDRVMGEARAEFVSKDEETQYRVSHERTNSEIVKRYDAEMDEFRDRLSEIQKDVKEILRVQLQRPPPRRDNP